MKKILVTFLCVVAAIAAHAQFQLANGDFENWETVEYTATKVCEEPVSWSSFYDATGGMKSFGTGTTPQIYKDEDVRPESAGQYSCRITSRSVFGVVAQGNLTTGCVNMGSSSATDASGNYNYINEAREDQAMRFSGRPDAVRFWVKFSGVKTGNSSVLLTTKGYYQDPVYADRNTAILVGQALSGDRIVSNDEWTEYTVPFEWLSEEQPYYALVNVSTCSEPGGGNAADYLYIDDIEMIYNSEATAINYGGENILGSELVSEDFSREKMGNIVTNGRGAKASWKFESSIKTLTVTVEGDNVSEDPANVHVYQIAFTGGEDAESGDDEGGDEGGDDPATDVPQPVELVKNNTYYIFNKATGLFLRDDNRLGVDAVTEWIIGEDNTVRAVEGKSVNITIVGNSGIFGNNKPKSITIKTDASEATVLTIAGDVKGYNFSATTSWNYGVWSKASYTAYLTGNGSELTYADNGSSDAGKWQLYDVNEYKLYMVRKALEEEMLRAEQIGMDVEEVRRAIETSESASELQSLLDQLRLDEAQYVSDKYTEDRTILLGTTDLTDNSRWTTDLVTNKSQHWSGDPDRIYYEMHSDHWAESSWSASAEQTVELPAGQYLLKAAGRSSVFAQAKMSVDGVEVAFPAKDDYGYGIDVEGNVNFSSNGVYCNDGAGRGWQYRYIAIDMKQRGNVTMKFNASAETIHQWFSVVDIELLAVPTPTLEMVSFDYDGESYTPDEEGKIDLSEIYYDETKECEVITKGYGVVTTSFDSETAVYTITLSQEDGYDYELEPVEYQVQFHEIPAPQEFTESLTVNMGGEPMPCGDITVYLAEKPDETYNFELSNLVIDLGAFPMPIGTIRLTDIEMEERLGVLCFTKEQTIVIAPGTDEQFNPEDWIGPMLGELQIVLDEGYVYDGHMFAHLSIVQGGGDATIEVTVGDKNNIPGEVTGIGTMKAENSADGLSDGKYFINGRVVVVKNGKRFSLSGQRL